MDNSKKPQTEPFLDYYVAGPLANLSDTLVLVAKRTRSRLAGGWPCDYCGTEHGRRVLRYSACDMYTGAKYTFCSLGATEIDWLYDKNIPMCTVKRSFR